MSDLEVISFRPEPGQYAWTFGGAAPVKRIRTPAVLEVYTEDCFAGRVRSEQDLVSQVCEFPFLNPQTGPFHIEGAEPGDTVAVHFVSIEPARSWAASTTVPLFGALTGTHLTALLQDPLPEVVWLWQLDAAARTCRFSARRSSFEMDLPMEPMHGTVGVAPANLEVRSALVPDAFGGNMDTPEMRAGVTCYLGVQRAYSGAFSFFFFSVLFFSPRRQRARRPALPRRRARPAGRGRDLRGRGRVRDEHRSWSWT